MHNTEVDVQQIVGRIRERLGHRRLEDTSDTSAILADSQLTADLSGLCGTCDPAQVTLVSHRKILGGLVVGVKRIVRNLLTPTLTRQAAYNTMNARAASRLHEHLAALFAQQRQTRDDLVAAQRAATQKAIDLREELLAAVRDELQALRLETGQMTQNALVAAQRAATQKAIDLREELLAAVQGVREGIREVEALREESRAVRDGLQALRLEMGQMTQNAHALRQRHDENLLSVRERMASTEGRLRRILSVLTKGEPDQPIETGPESWPARSFKPEFDSLRFGERFWGSEAELRERRRMYVDVFRGHEDVLDLGSGRAEFLGLLADAGITARGVDTDLDMVLLSREKGLDVVQEDAFAYLTSLPDASLGGIFAAQIVEHFEAAQVIELVRLCHRKLRPGGVLVMETPNPMCLMVFAQCLYMDFTHTRPIHPEALKFLAESVGFHDVTLQFTSPTGPSLQIPLLSDPRLYGPQGEQFNRSIAYVNELLFGYQDYAIIGHK